MGNPYEDYPQDWGYDHGDKVILKLLRICRKLLSEERDNVEIWTQFNDAVNEAESLYEDDDPRSNGWVGDNGLP